MKKKRRDPQGAMAVYVDDTLGTGNNDFKKITEVIPKTVESKQREFSPFLFAGINIKNKYRILHRTGILCQKIVAIKTLGEI